MHKLRKMSLLLVAALALTGLFSRSAYATHFRYGTIQWAASPTAPRTVTFQMQTAWRWDYPWLVGARPAVGTTFNSGYTIALGDGSTAQVMLTVTAVDPADDWMAATTTLTHTYTGDGPYTVQFENCCRLSSLLDNNHDLNFILESVVHLTATTAEQSPTASSLPIITLPQNVPSTFQIPASDPDGTIASYAFTPLAASGLQTQVPPGMTMTTAGFVSWTPTALGLYATQVVITDNDGNSIPLDVILDVVRNQGGTPPTVLVNNAATPASLTAQVGSPVSFTVGATDPDTDPATGLANTLVTLGSGGLPPGATTAPAMPFTQRVPNSAAFTWTPTLAQAGQSYTIVFSATDNTGLQSTNSVTIHVANPNPPIITCTPATYALQATSASGASVVLGASVSDPNQLPLTVTWTIDGAGTAAQTDSVAGGTAGPTPLSLSQTFAVGSHTVAVTATNSFFASATCDIGVDISKADQTISFPSIAPLTFGDAPAALSATASSGLPVSFQVVSGPGTVSGNVLTITGAGTIKVAASQSGDATFNAAQPVTQDITVQQATPSVTATGGTFTYDGQPHPATASVTGPGGTVLGPVSITYNGSATVPVDAGTYNVAVSFAGDANDAAVSASTAIVINQATPTLVVTGGVFTYDGTAHPATVALTGVGGQPLAPVTLTYNGQAGVPVTGGTYAVVASFAGNTDYLPVSGTAVVQINRATTTVTVIGGTFPYDGGPHAATVTVMANGAVVSTPVVMSYGGQPAAPVNAGSYAVTASFVGDQNYMPASGTGTVTITPASLIVTAASGSMAYGGVVPSLGVTYSGFVGTDGPANLASPAVLSTTATPTSPVGIYPVLVSGASSPNYTISFVNGLLTVTQATLTITADNQTKWFDAAVPALTVTYSGFVNGDTPASLTTPVTVTTTAQTLSPSGTYPIVPGGATDPNYTINFVNGTLTVLGLQQVKSTARAALAALEPTGDRQLDHELDEALRDIDASLEPRLWADDSHLTAQGQKVFVEEQQAVRELEEQFRRAPASLSATLTAQADVLVQVDRALAQSAVDEAVAAGIDSRWLSDPASDILDGDRELVTKDGDDAIERYKDAWQDVQQVVRRLTDHGHDGDDHDHHHDHDGDNHGGPGGSGDHGPGR
ncbi:MAG TPA: MBG domain-containing protein [Vicinamibacterales bacterium]